MRARALHWGAMARSEREASDAEALRCGVALTAQRAELSMVFDRDSALWISRFGAEALRGAESYAERSHRPTPRVHVSTVSGVSIYSEPAWLSITPVAEPDSPHRGLIVRILRDGQRYYDFMVVNDALVLDLPGSPCLTPEDAAQTFVGPWLRSLSL